MSSLLSAGQNSKSRWDPVMYGAFEAPNCPEISVWSRGTLLLSSKHVFQAFNRVPVELQGPQKISLFGIFGIFMKMQGFAVHAQQVAWSAFGACGRPSPSLRGHREAYAPSAIAKLAYPCLCTIPGPRGSIAAIPGLSGKPGSYNSLQIPQFGQRGPGSTIAFGTVAL